MKKQTLAGNGNTNRVSDSQTKVTEIPTEQKQPGRVWADYSPQQNLQHLFDEAKNYPSENLPQIAEEINKQGYPLKAIASGEGQGQKIGLYRELIQPEKRWNPRLNYESESPGGYQYGLVFADKGYRPVEKSQFDEYVKTWREYQERDEPYYIHVEDTDKIYSETPKLEKGIANGQNKLVEVEEDELILKKDGEEFYVVGDFEGGKSHEEGGELYQLQKGDIVIPANKRKLALKHLRNENWSAIEKMRKSLPKVMPKGKKLQEGLDTAPKRKPLQSETGIRNFIKQDMEMAGAKYSDEAADEILKSYNNDYDRIISDAGTRAGVKDQEAFMKDIYESFDIVKPDEEALAEMSFIREPRKFKDEATGYDRYAQLEDELNLTRSMMSRLKEGDKEPIQLGQPIEAVSDVTQVQAPMESIFPEEELMSPETKQAQVQRRVKEQRVMDLQDKMDEINAAIAEQARQNVEQFGYTSKQHEEVTNQFNKYDELLKEAENASRRIYTAIGGPSVSLYDKEDRKKIKNLSDIRDIYSKMGKVLGSPQGEEFNEQLRGLMYGFGNNFFTKDFATLGLNEMGRLMNVKDAFDTYNSLKGEAENIYSKLNLTPDQVEQAKEEFATKNMPSEQKALLDTYKLLLEVQSGTNANFGTDIGEGLKEMIPFIAQFAATGGYGAAAKKLVKEFVEAKTKSAVAGKIAGAIAKPAVMGALMLPANLQNYAERVAPTIDEEGNLIEGQKPVNAAFKAYLSTVAEVAGEDIGSFANKWANDAARKNFMKLIANNPNKAQEFLGKMSLALTRETGVPSVQGFLFEGIGEEATGIMQAAIDQDGSFFTPEAQAQLWVMSLLASGGFSALSVPNRIATRQSYNQSVQLLNDIPNADYTQAVQEAANNVSDPEELMNVFDDVSKQMNVSEQDYYKARSFIGNTIRYNQMNTARAIELDQKIAQNVGSDGMVTLTNYDGQPYSVRNPEALGKPGAVVFIRAQDGTVKPVTSSKISQWETQSPEDVRNTQMAQQDQTDDVIQQEQQIQQEAAQRGLVEGKTVNTPHGKKTLVAINPDGTATVEDTKGEPMTVNVDEIEAYKTQEQKDAEKVQEEADKAAIEQIDAGAEVISDEPLTEGSDIRVIDYSDGTSEIVTPEGTQSFETPEERDAAIQELVAGELAATEENIDDMPPEQAFATMRKKDTEIAAEIFAGEIEALRQQAQKARNQVSEVTSRKQKQDLLTQAKQLENEAARLDAILADPSVLDVVEEEEVTTPAPATVESTADQLYNEYRQEEEASPYNQLAPWQQELIGTRINPDSFAQWGDPNYVTSGIARAWFAPKNQVGPSNNIDVIAEELSQQTGQNVTEQDIIDFIVANPSGSIRKTTNRMNELAKEYRDLTGKSIKNHIPIREEITGVADVEDSPLGETPTDVPFRAAEVNITEQAMSDLQSRQNAVKELNKLQEKFGVPIEVVNSNEMPTNVIDRARILGVIPKAFYTNGKAYIISDQITSVSDVKKSYLHESVLHKGLDVLFEAGPVTLLGKTYNSKNELLDDVFNRMDDESITSRAKIYAPGVPIEALTESQKKELAEEALATLNETESPRLQVMLDKLYNYIKKLLGFTSKQFTKADLRNMLREHRDLLIKNKQDAETISIDEKGVLETRTIGETGREEGRAYIQREAEAGAEAGDAGQQVSFRTDEGQSFDQWKGNNEYVEGEDVSQVQTGTPIVAKGYHGTTHEFYEFKGGEIGNIEGHLGRTNYFTTNYADAEGNYGAEGADITGRIEQRKEQLDYEVEEFVDEDTFDYEGISEQFDIPIEDIQDLDIIDDISKVIAQKELLGGKEQVLELYLKMNNPLVLGEGPVYIDTIDETELTDYIDDAAEEIADEYGVDIDEAKEYYSFEIRERAVENSGAENKLIEALRLALEGNDNYDEPSQFLGDAIYEGEVDLNALDSELRAALNEAYLVNEEGQLISSQVMSDFYEELGYDGIILTDVADRFPNMGLYQGVSHIHIPDQYNNHIKLADGSNVTFGESPDIRFRVAESQQELDDFVKDSKVKETVYHGTKVMFDEFDINKFGQSDTGWLGKGFYFTDDIEYAESYVDKETGRLMSVKLDMRNPYVFRKLSRPESLNKELGVNNAAEATKLLKEQGYDSIMQDYEGDREFIVFEPSQILIEPTEDVKFRVDEQREQVNTNPSEAEKQAGNYKMGHVKIDGFDITIENPIGSIRSGVNQEGERWSNVMPADYGYFKGTVGKDKDHIDVFLGPNLESDKVYVVDQVDPKTGKFDEHKVLMGYNSISEARNAYNEAYDEGWAGLGAITRTTKDGLKEWFKGDTKKPFAPEEEVRFRVSSQDPEVQKMLDRLQAVEKLSKEAARLKGLESEHAKAMGIERDYIQQQINTIKEGAKIGKEDTKEMIGEVQKAITDYAKKHLPMTEAGARELGSLLTVIKDAQTPDAIESAVQKIDELTGRTTEKTERRKNVAKVNRLLKWMTWLKKSGTKRVGKFNYEDTVAFQELKDIDKRTTELTKKANSWKSTAEEKMEAEDALDGLWNTINEKEDKTALDNAMMKLIELRRLGSNASAKLSQIVAEELEAIYSQAKDAKSEADLEKALRRKEDKEYVKSFLTGGDKALVDKPWFKRAMTQINSGTADIMGNWETLMTMIGGTELRDKMSLMLNEAQMSVGRQETMDNVLDDAKDIYGSKSRTETLNTIHDLSKEEYSLRQPNRKGEPGEGKPMNLSKLHLMDIYNAIKNPDVQRDYYMSYGDITMAEDGSRDVDAQMADGEMRINALLDNLSEQDKQFADAMQAELDKYYDRLNEIHITLYNRDLPRVENYWPSTAEREQDIDVMEQFFADSRHPSATKERSAHRTPQPRDAFNKFTKHIDEAEWYSNMALPVNDINKIFKDNNIKSLIEDARGKNFYKNISEALQNVGLMPPGKQQQPSKLTSLLNPLLNNWVASKIGATPSVPLKQLLSAVNYAENMPVADWTTGFIKGLANPAKTWNEMMKIPYLKARLGDGYSEAVQRALNGDENVHRSKATNFHSAFKNLMTIGTRYGDITAIIFGGKPYLDYLIKKEGLSEKEAVDKFLQDTLRSQQAPFSSTLSKLQNSKNPFFRAVFAFANTPSQYMRKLFEANQNLRVQRQRYKDGKISKEEVDKAMKQTIKAHTIYGLVNTVTFTMAGSLISAFMRGSDPDDEIWKDMVAQLSQTYIGGLPVIKDILGTLTKKALGMKIYDSAQPFVEGLDEVVDAGMKLTTGEAKDPAKEYEKIGQGVATMLGVPYYNIKKDIQAIPPFREETFRNTRIKETDDKLNKLDDNSEQAQSIKKAYSKAKAKATRLRKKGKEYQADRIETLIGDSKVSLWENGYDDIDIQMEMSMFERQLDSLD